MIQLKKLLNELDVRRGHFMKDTSLDLIEDYLYNDGVVPNSVADKIMDAINSAEDDRPLSKPLQSLLISKVGTKVYGSGTIQVFKKQTPDGIIYSGFDFSLPVQSGLFFFGRILTEKLDRRLEYSPKKQLNIDNAESIHLSQVSKDHLGKGYGKVLYDAVMKSTDIVYSDSVLFEGSFKVWINHIRRKSKFFGIVGWGGVIFPIFTEEGLNKTKLMKVSDFSGGLVGITKKVPTQLIKLQEFLNGVEPYDIAIFSTEDKLQGVMKDIESFASMNDFMNDYSHEYGSLKSGVGCILSGNSTIFVKESGDDLEYFIL